MYIYSTSITHTLISIQIYHVIKAWKLQKLVWKNQQVSCMISASVGPLSLVKHHVLSYAFTSSYLV